MSTNTITPQQGILELGVAEWRTTEEFSLKYRNGTPQEVWLEDMKQLFRLWDGKEKLDARLRFLIGDALVFGRAAYGEEYAQSIELAAGALGDVRQKSVENIMLVCQSVPADVRRPDGLTFSHHDAVAGIKDPEKQKELLTTAIAEGMSVSALRNAAARKSLEAGDIKLLEQQTDKEIAELSASDIKKLLKRAKSGEPAKRTLIIDLDSEEALQQAAGHILIYWQAEREKISDWSKARKDAWGAIQDLAVILMETPGEAARLASLPDAISAIADQYERYEEKDVLTEDQIDALEPLAKLWRRHRQSGHAKKKPEPAATEEAA